MESYSKEGKRQLNTPLFLFVTAESICGEGEPLVAWDLGLLFGFFLMKGRRMKFMSYVCIFYPLYYSFLSHIRILEFYLIQFFFVPPVCVHLLHICVYLFVANVYACISHVTPKTGS